MNRELHDILEKLSIQVAATPSRPHSEADRGGVLIDKKVSIANLVTWLAQLLALVVLAVKMHGEVQQHAKDILELRRDVAALSATTERVTRLDERLANLTRTADRLADRVEKLMETMRK